MEDTLKMQLETSLLTSASKVPQKPGMETSHTELMESKTLKRARRNSATKAVSDF